MSRKETIYHILRTIMGLIIFAFGTYLTIKANIGLAPWESFSMGVSMHIPFTYGITHTFIGLFIIVLDLLLKEKIGYGTVLDALVVGVSVDFFAYLDFTPPPANLFVSIALMVVGLFIVGLGQFFYMSAGLSCGPRDAFLVALGKRVPKVPIGAVSIVIYAVVFSAGWLLGAPVGVGTIIATFGAGIAMQIVFGILHFEPRAIRHSGIIETTKILIGRKKEPENHV